MKWIVWLSILSVGHGFVSNPLGMRMGARMSTKLASLSNSVLSSSAAPTASIRPSTVEKARTVTYICSSGTLCTTSALDQEQCPFGSYVDYIIDDKGWPVLLLGEQSLHTQNIKQHDAVSLFCQLPRSRQSQTAAALSRVTLMGKVHAVPAEDLLAIKTAFCLVHPYAEQIADSSRFGFYRIEPKKIYFSGGFGVQATWIDVPAYEAARPDVLAQEVAVVLSRVNLEKQLELLLLCKHFLGLTDVEGVRIQAIDQLGIDLRVKQGEYTDEYRIGFRNSVRSAEDAKSEMTKLFLEAWERDQGSYDASSQQQQELPAVTKYAEDILRHEHSRNK